RFLFSCFPKGPCVAMPVAGEAWSGQAARKPQAAPFARGPEESIKGSGATLPGPQGSRGGMSSDGVLVRVSTNIIVDGGPAMTFWIAATNDPKAAEEVVRKKVSETCLVEATLMPVLPDTLKKLG